MNTSAWSPSTANATPAHRGWLAVSRKRAFFTHLAASAMVVGAACSLIFLLWYPYPYFHVAGAWNVLRVLIGVDLVLGPLLTLIVFKPGKPGLKLDLAIIAVVQLAALVYGLTAIYRERPYFTVFAVDRFVVLAQRDVDRTELLAAKTEGRIDDKPLRGPMLVVAMRPTDEAQRQKLLDETVFGGKPDIERRPEFWIRFADGAQQVIDRRRPLSELRAAWPDAADDIARLTAKHGVAEDRLGFLPLTAKSRYVTLVVDATTGAPLDVIDIDPWTAAK